MSSLHDQRVRQAQAHDHLALGSLLLPFVWPEVTCNL